MREHRTVIAADSVKLRTQKCLERLANARMQEWLTHSRFKNGRVSFGMGDEYIELGGKQFSSWDVEVYPKLQSLFDALEDVEDITDGYRLGCPEDLKF